MWASFKHQLDLVQSTQYYSANLGCKRYFLKLIFVERFMPFYVIFVAKNYVPETAQLDVCAKADMLCCDMMS